MIGNPARDDRCLGWFNALHPLFWCSILGILLFSGASKAQEQSCSPGQTTILDMVQSQFSSAITQLYSSLAPTYMAKLVFSSKMFDLVPGKCSTDRLLRLLPRNQSERVVLMTMADAQCSRETGSEMQALDQMRNGLSRQWSEAVLLDPSFMQAYVEASIGISRNPNSRFADEMVKVCEKAPIPFSDAVHRMSQQKQRIFSREVFHLKGCKPIALPEY